MPALEMKVSKQGLTQMMRALPRLEDAVLDLAGEAIVDEAQRRVPVRTGDLLSSIGYYRESQGRYKVVAGMFYASFVEYGTRFMAARPYLRPAFERVNWLTLAQQAVRRLGF